jgi:hypothetical protein
MNVNPKSQTNISPIHANLSVHHDSPLLSTVEVCLLLVSIIIIQRSHTVCEKFF